MLKEAIGLYPDGIKSNNWDAVRLAAEIGHLDILEYFHSITDISDGIKVDKWYAVRKAARHGDLDILKYFHSITNISDGIKSDNWYVVRKANTETKQWLNDTYPELMKEYVN